jgi:hypothetical protein
LRDFTRGGELKAKIEIWRRFRNLNRFERGVAIQAAIGLVATRIGLRLIGFRGWQAAIVRLTRAGTHRTDPADSVIVDSARAIARMALSAARHLPFRPNCLEQSLTLWWMLRKRGIAAELLAGARKEAGSFEAHAWVECGAAVLNDASGEHLHFTPFDGPLTSMETQTP